DREARFDQQLAADRAGPLRLGRVVLLRRADVRRVAGDGVAGWRRVLVASELADAIEVGRELVPGRQLRRQPQDAAADACIVDRLITVLEKAVGDVLIDAPVAIRREEPQAVL